MSQELFDEADRLENSGHADLALGVWRQLAETCPNHNVFLRLASITRDLGLMNDAQCAFRRALDIDNNSPLALIGLGVLAIDSGNYGDATNYLKRALDIQEDPGGLTLLGVALRNVGKDVEAEASYRRAIRIDPKHDEAYYNLGVLFRDDRPSEALGLFRKALELDPNLACAHRELGFLLMKRGVGPEAESHLRTAIQLEPNDVWAHIYLGTCLWRFSDADSAIAEFQLAGKLAPEWAVPLWSLGNIYEYDREEFDLAQSFFERALELEPDSQVALDNLCRIQETRQHRSSQELSD